MARGGGGGPPPPESPFAGGPQPPPRPRGRHGCGRATSGQSSEGHLPLTHHVALDTEYEVPARINSPIHAASAGYGAGVRNQVSSASAPHPRPADTTRAGATPAGCPTTRSWEGCPGRRARAHTQHPHQTPIVGAGLSPVLLTDQPHTRFPKTLSSGRRLARTAPGSQKRASLARPVVCYTSLTLEQPARVETHGTRCGGGMGSCALGATLPAPPAALSQELSEPHRFALFCCTGTAGELHLKPLSCLEVGVGL